MTVTHAKNEHATKNRMPKDDVREEINAKIIELKASVKHNDISGSNAAISSLESLLTKI